jgi:hypothetical protein
LVVVSPLFLESWTQVGDSSLTVQNLFEELNHKDFPDQVNEPTLACLNQFLKSIKLPEVEGVTVRKLVLSMLKMRVPDECQFWRVFSSLPELDTMLFSKAQRRGKRVLELQRAVVRLSWGVFGVVQEAYKEYKDQPRKQASEVVLVAMLSLCD